MFGMREKKYPLYFTDDKKRIILMSLVELINELIKERKCIDSVDDLLLKHSFDGIFMLQEDLFSTQAQRNDAKLNMLCGRQSDFCDQPPVGVYFQSAPCDRDDPARLRYRAGWTYIQVARSKSEGEWLFDARRRSDHHIHEVEPEHYRRIGKGQETARYMNDCSMYILLVEFKV